jgi:DNA invertase Pin-like site-specific DNA recombinase
MRVVIQSRVSTIVQENKRQIDELKDYASKKGWEVVKVFEETISGAKKNDERPVLKEMIDYIKINKIDKVLCWELSRIGRNSLEVLKTIQLLNENYISLFIKNYNIETLNERGEVNPLSQFMVQILTSVSEMERTQIRSRIKSGYDSYRKNGGKVGRKVGYSKDKETLLGQHKDIVKYLRQGQSVRNVMKLTGKSSGTVQKIKKLLSC